MKILLISFVLILSSCTLLEKSLEKPKVNLKTVEVTESTLTDATLVFNFQVENPNSVPITVDQVDYNVKLNNKDFSKGLLDKGFKVAANASTLVPLPLKVKFSDLFSSLADFVNSGKTTYQVDGSVKMGLLKIPFNDKGEVKLSELTR